MSTMGHIIFPGSQHTVPGSQWRKRKLIYILTNSCTLLARLGYAFPEGGRNDGVINWHCPSRAKVQQAHTCLSQSLSQIISFWTELSSHQAALLHGSEVWAQLPQPRLGQAMRTRARA